MNCPKPNDRKLSSETTSNSSAQAIIGATTHYTKDDGLTNRYSAVCFPKGRLKQTCPVR
jgi:hypothetical protein